jgi:hypothetical protein
VTKWVDLGGSLVPSNDFFDPNTMLGPGPGVRRPRTLKKKNEGEGDEKDEDEKDEKDEKDEQEDDDDPEDPEDANIDLTFNPRYYHLTPRPWASFWAILRTAKLGMRFVNNVHECKVS